MSDSLRPEAGILLVWAALCPVRPSSSLCFSLTSLFLSFRGMMCFSVFPFQSVLRVQAGSMSTLLAMSLPLSQKPWRK